MGGTVQFTGNLYRSYLTNCPDKTKTYVSLGIASVSSGNDMLDITFTYNSVVVDIRDLGGSFGSYTVVSVSDQTPSSSPTTSSSPSLSPLSFSPLLLLLLSLSLLLLA